MLLYEALSINSALLRQAPATRGLGLHPPLLLGFFFYKYRGRNNNGSLSFFVCNLIFHYPPSPSIPAAPCGGILSLSSSFMGITQLLFHTRKQGTTEETRVWQRPWDFAVDAEFPYIHSPQIAKKGRGREHLLCTGVTTCRLYTVLPAEKKEAADDRFNSRHLFFPVVAGRRNIHRQQSVLKNDSVVCPSPGCNGERNP